MTFALVLSFFCLSSAFVGSVAGPVDTALVEPAFCTQGQATWCRNFGAAADCNAVRHCLQTVWLTQKPTVASCGTCEADIQNLRRAIGSHTTKQVVRELLENLCGLNFVTELLRQRCERYVDRYVDSYFNELLDLLESEISPATLCHILGFCDVDSTEDAVIRFRNILLYLPSVDFLASTRLAGSKCSWGPSYWCRNLTTSKECASTSYCIQNVWSSQLSAHDDDSVCQVCKNMVQQACDQLQSNETQLELRQVLEGSCKLIPIKVVRDQCCHLADDFELELTEMLLAQMNPTVVCTVAGLCNSPGIDHLLERSNSCANCTLALTAVERYLQRAPRSQIFDKLTALCGQLSAYAEFCEYALLSSFDYVYETLKTELRPFPGCYLADMCPYDQSAHDFTSQLTLNSMADDLPCDLCKQLVKHLKQVLATNTTEYEFLAILHGICEHSKSFKQTCLEVVDNDFQKIYKFVADELNPEVVCSEVNICPKKESDQTLQLIDHQPVSALTVPAAENSECRFCVLLVELLQKEMKKPEYRHDIKKLLGKICSLVPRLERNKCNQFVQKHGDALIKLLVEQTNPSTICKLLGQCLVVPSEDLCPICKEVMGYLEKEMQNPQEQEKVERVLRKVCKIVPASRRKSCATFVDDYTALILGVLSEELDPISVCPALKLCPSQLSAVERCNQCQRLIGDMTRSLGSNRSPLEVIFALESVVPAENSDLFSTAVQLKIDHGDDVVDMMLAGFDAQESCVFLRFCEPDMISDALAVEQQETNDISDMTAPLTKPSCELCELMVQLYVDKLTSNATEAEIVADLQKFCAKIKNPEFRSNCSHFVQKYVPQVVKLLKKDVTPQEVCSLVKLCPPKLDIVSAVTHDGCEFCEAVVGSLEALSADPHMMTKSVKYLLDICNVFPTPNARVECMKIVANVGSQLESIALGIPSWFYCSKMHMCPYGAHLSYKQICSHPSQWCADAAKAVLCGRLSYCQESVWMSDKPSL